MSARILNELENLSDYVAEISHEWIKLGDDGLLRLIDPLDKYEISAHYGFTHLAVSFLIKGIRNKDNNIYSKGKELLKSALYRWDLIKNLPGSHLDFNNFAVCVATDYLEDDDLIELIKDKVIKTSDSNHYTINWLPMRWYVNLKKIEWTKDKKYNKTIERCKKYINTATNIDGGVEDILPKGNSYNLQYNIATVGGLQFLRCRGESIMLTKELGFLIQNVGPDGDINYQGRGVNQIFAWGIWIYLLSSSNQLKQLEIALRFVRNKIRLMLGNNNLMLNNFKGESKLLWWDYHYTSVYISHFLFWITLAMEDFNSKSIQGNECTLNETGISIFKNDKCFISTFAGRKKYLAEKGPVITYLYTKKHGVILKGSFGPWLGLFGNKYSYGTLVFQNFFGLLSIKRNINLSKFRVLNKLADFREMTDFQQISPMFSPFSILSSGNKLSITFQNPKRKKVFLNIPVFEKVLSIPKFKVFGEEHIIELHEVQKLKNQYGWCKIYQSRIFIFNEIRIELELN